MGSAQAAQRCVWAARAERELLERAAQTALFGHSGKLHRSPIASGGVADGISARARRENGGVHWAVPSWAVPSLVQVRNPRTDATLTLSEGETEVALVYDEAVDQASQLLGEATGTL